ncbi:MAG: transcriptional repressor, partial [Actinomycetota bacterium]|nr:transcriptional repressor [Actinomycetota bacterium]
MNSATTRQAWLASAHVALREAGYRAGGAREAILEALAVSDGCLNVQELIAVVSERGASVGTASAYRVLADLERVGVLRRIDL